MASSRFYGGSDATRHLESYWPEEDCGFDQGAGKKKSKSKKTGQKKRVSRLSRSARFPSITLRKNSKTKSRKTRSSSSKKSSQVKRKMPAAVPKRTFPNFYSPYGKGVSFGNTYGAEGCCDRRKY